MLLAVRNFFGALAIITSGVLPRIAWIFRERDVLRDVAQRGHQPVPAGLVLEDEHVGPMRVVRVGPAYAYARARPVQDKRHVRGRLARYDVIRARVRGFTHSASGGAPPPSRTPRGPLLRAGVSHSFLTN
jgi:hypothetical protein